MKKIIFFSLLFWCHSCSSPFQEERLKFSDPETSNLLSKYFLQKYEEQKGHSIDKNNILLDHTLLTDYIIRGTSPMWGYFYSIPLINNTTNIVDACVIYSINEYLSIEKKKIEGKIGEPIVFTPETFVNLKDKGECFIHSVNFITWEYKGLSVPQKLTSFAKEIYLLTQANDKLLTKSTTSDYNCSIRLSYSVSSYSYSDGTGITVSTPGIAAINEIIIQAFSEYYDVAAPLLVMKVGSLYLQLSNGRESLKDCFNTIMNKANFLIESQHRVTFTSFYYDLQSSEQGENTSGGAYGPGGGIGSSSPTDNKTQDKISNLSIDITGIEDVYISTLYNHFFKTSKTFQNILKDFCKENSIAHLKWEISNDLPNHILGKFNPLLKDYTFTIELNEIRLINLPALVVCKTIIHEAIHAKIFLDLIKIANNPVGEKLERVDVIDLKSALNSQNFPTLFNYYEQYGYHSTSQHEYMADYYINTIANALQEMNPRGSREVHVAIAWQGLKKTNAWQRMPEKKRNYLDGLYQYYLTHNYSIVIP